MKYVYIPKGVCSSKMTFDIEGDVVKNVEIERGCPGNLLAISTLLQNQKIDDIIAKLEGIKCGLKSTSCPDQIARALIDYKQIKRND